MASVPPSYPYPNTGTGTQDFVPVPSLTANVSDSALERAIDARIIYNNLLWLWLISKWRLAELMDESEQWIRRAFSAANSMAAWQWVPDDIDPEDPSELPRPVFNEGFSVRANESSRLSRPRYRPEVRPNRDNPDALTRQACKRMTRYLLSELDRMRWSTEQDIAHYRMPLHGQMIFKSWWEQRWDDTIPVASKDAKACPRNPMAMPGKKLEGQPCNFSMATGTVSGEEAAKAGVTVPEDASVVSISACPQCDDHPPLVPIAPSMDELKGGPKDTFGKPLASDQPMGRWKLECVSPYDVFLPNCGVNMRWDDVSELVHVHVESLDWVALHFPDKAAAVRPESPSALMQYHPIAGSPTLYGRGTQASLFKNHVRVKELFQKPRMEYDEVAKRYTLNKGRWIVMANGVRLVDTTYLMESLTAPGTWVERAVFELPPWEFRDGGLLAWGLSLWDLMVSAQDTINEIASQRAAVRERCALPLFWAPKDSNFTYSDRSTGVPGMLVESELMAGFPGESAVPRIISNTTIAEGVNEEEQRAITFVNNVGGRSDIEKGDVPGDVSAATAINILREESGTTRSQRIDRIKQSHKRLYSHGARLCCAMIVEPRPFKYDDNGHERWERAKGMDFLGQTDVSLEAEPEFDSEDQQREAVRDIVKLGIDLTSPQGRKVARHLGAPADFFDDDDVQELQCDREWWAFVQDARNPVFDPSLDDPDTHFQNHGRRCSDEAFIAWEDAANWDGALGILADGWDETLQVAFAGPKATAVPVSTAPQAPGMPPGVAFLPYEQAVQMGLAQPVQPMTPETRVIQAWMQKLEMFRWTPKDEKAFARVLGWRAHIEVCRLFGEQKKAKAMGQPVMAAPGAGQTTAGTEVTPGTPASQIQPQPAVVQ